MLNLWQPFFVDTFKGQLILSKPIEMKYPVVVIFLLVTNFFWSQSQNNLTAPQSISVEKQSGSGFVEKKINKGPVHVSAGVPVEREKTVEYYDYYILSIKEKVNWVKSNVEEDKKAKESGWYDKMESYLKVAEEERALLIKSMDQ